MRDLHARTRCSAYISRIITKCFGEKRNNSAISQLQAMEKIKTGMALLVLLRESLCDNIRTDAPECTHVFTPELLSL